MKKWYQKNIPYICVFKHVKHWKITERLEKLVQGQTDPNLTLSESHSVVSNSLQSHGLYSPWNSLGQITGVGSCSLLQGIFPTQGSNPALPHCRQIPYQLSHQGSPKLLGYHINTLLILSCLLDGECVCDRVSAWRRKKEKNMNRNIHRGHWRHSERDDFQKRMGEKAIWIFSLAAETGLTLLLTKLVGFALFKLCQGKRELNGFSLIWKSDCQRGGPGLGKSGDSYSQRRKGAYSCWICSGVWDPSLETGLSVPHHGTEETQALMPHLQSLHSRAVLSNGHTSGDAVPCSVTSAVLLCKCYRAV